MRVTMSEADVQAQIVDALRYMGHIVLVTSRQRHRCRKCGAWGSGGERIAVGRMFGEQTAADVKRGDPVQYDSVELALIAGLSREQLLLIHAVKRVMGGTVMPEEGRER